MSGTITIDATMRVLNGNFEETIGPRHTQETQNAQGADGGIRTIGTSEETISLTDLSSPGRAWLENLDETNYVQVGPDSGGSMVPFLRLDPGQANLLTLEPGVTLKAKADTAPVKLLVRVYER